MRELRSRQAKMDKKGLAGRAVMSYGELRALFPLLREATIRGKLVNECQCEIVRVRAPFLAQISLIRDLADQYSHTIAAAGRALLWCLMMAACLYRVTQTSTRL